MTDTLNAIPPNLPHRRPLGQRTSEALYSINNAAQNAQTGIIMGFSYPGIINTISPGVAWPWPRNYSGYVALVTANLGTPDGSNAVTVGFWYNGVEFTTLTIAAGATQARAQAPSTTTWAIAGNLTDIFQVSVDTYAGSTAANLTWHIHAF